MEVIDLSQLMCPEMPVYPGAEGPLSIAASTLAEAGFVEKKIILYSHTGTHIDAPAHMFDQGTTLDKMTAEKFIGRGLVVDCAGIRDGRIGLDHLLPQGTRIKEAEFLLLRTGWSRYWGTEEYFSAYPVLTEEAAAWLSGFSLKGIGVDAVSVDAGNAAEFIVHKMLLAKNILIIENLTNLSAAAGREFILSVLPMKLAEAEGAPVRAVAIIL